MLGLGREEMMKKVMQAGNVLTQLNENLARIDANFKELAANQKATHAEVVALRKQLSDVPQSAEVVAEEEA